MVSVPTAAIYRSKSSSSAKYATVKSDTPLAIVREDGEWFGVLMSNGQIGWIKAMNVKETGYELVANKPVNRGGFTSRGGQVSRTENWLDELVRTASQVPVAKYIYGGTNPATGMDCSAFVRMVFGQYNVKLPRTAREQALVGQTVPFDQLQPGDRLYFSCRNSYIDHCGIYAGNGHFVHCSASRNGVGLDSLASDFFWRSLVVAKRS
jgi:cell wall-associated NlpC family hydrolase